MRLPRTAADTWSPAASGWVNTRGLPRRVVVQRGRTQPSALPRTVSLVLILADLPPLEELYDLRPLERAAARLRASGWQPR